MTVSPEADGHLALTMNGRPFLRTPGVHNHLQAVLGGMRCGLVNR
ncbi:hypothetical protein [Cyanobium sp. NIES-981]|nr:hypothetical protein [Cyanobium sp. NIES-981]